MSDIVYKNFAFSTPFLRGYKELRIPIIDSAGNPAWPELFGPEKIEEMRLSVGPRHFSAQMMLEFVAPDRVRLDPGALHFYTDEFDARTARIGDMSVTGAAVYWDPASGRKKSDGSVCVLVYRDDRGRRAFIHDVMYMVVEDGDTHPMTGQCRRVLDFMARHGMRRVAIEVNGIGNTLPEIMRDIAAGQSFNLYIDKIVNNRNKESRILDAMESILTTGRLFAHVRVQQTPLISEMIGWSPLGTSVHDDGLDAVAGALCVTPSPVRAAGSFRPITAHTDFKI